MATKIGIAEELLEGAGFKKMTGGRYLKWLHEADIAAIATRTSLSRGRRTTFRFGYYSRFIAENGFGLTAERSPTQADCESSGITFDIEDLMKEPSTKIRDGWPTEELISNKKLVARIEDAIKFVFLPMAQRLSTYIGWEVYLREKADIAPGRAGFWLSMLAYAIIAQRSRPFDDIADVLEAHLELPKRIRADEHLARQRALVRSQYGRDIDVR